MTSNILMHISHLSKRYHSHLVVNDISCEIYDGEFISILGPSGGGKSTLLQMIAGLITPDAGEIRIGKKLVSSPRVMVPPEKRGVNMVFQNYALWPHMDVYDHIAYGLKHKKLSKAERDQHVRRLLELLVLQGLEKRLPAELSGGQQQRVSIARALATEPRILMLDEPMSNLDGYLRLQMRSELKSLFRKLGTTVLYVTHDPEEALAMADRLIIIRGGRIEQMGTPQHCYTHPISPWAAGLLGAINRTTTSRSENGKEVILVGSQMIKGYCPIPNYQFSVGQQVELRSRPEDITISKEKPISLPSHYSMQEGIVMHCSFEGRHWRCAIDVGYVLLYALNDEPIKAGTKVWVSADSSKVFIYPIEVP